MLDKISLYQGFSNHLGLAGSNYIVEKYFEVCEASEKGDGRGNGLRILDRVNSQVGFEL